MIDNLSWLRGLTVSGRGGAAAGAPPPGPEPAKEMLR